MDVDEEIATAHNSGGTAMTALETIRYDWGSAYQIECDGDQWRARRLDGLGGWISADSADILRTQIFSDYTSKPVRRPPSS
jgi:hypothetical protein